MARRTARQTSAFISDFLKRQENPLLAKQSAMSMLVKSMARSMMGELDAPDESERELERLRKLAAQGNPFPLAARQWPFLVVDDPAEADLFRQARTAERLAFCTPRIQSAVLSDEGPVLRLDWWQMVLIAGMFDPTIGEIYVKGCTGAGKGSSTAIAVNLWYDVFHQSRTTLTSETFTHAQTNIFGEVCEWRRKMESPAPGSMLAEAIDHNERHYILVRNPASGDGEAFSGSHGPNTLYVFDEATATPDVLFKNAEKNARKIVALANPRTLSGWFRSAFSPLGERLDENGIFYGHIGLRMCLTIGGRDCINVANGRLRQAVAPRGGIEIEGELFQEGSVIPESRREVVRPLIPNQIDLALYRNNKAKPDPNEADVFAEGKFPREDLSKQVISASWMSPTHSRWLDVGDEIEPRCFGLDVARSLAGDRTVICWGDNRGVARFSQFRIPDIVQIADAVLRIAGDLGVSLIAGQAPVCIDYGGGYGSGVGDILATKGVWVIPFQPSGSSAYPRNFANLRTEAYAMLGKRLDPQGAFVGDPLAIPDEPGLDMELTAPEKKTASDGIRFGLESKDDVKAKLTGHSPDLADSLTYWFHGLRVLTAIDERLMAFRQPLILYPQPETASQAGQAGQPAGCGDGVAPDNTPPAGPPAPKTLNDQLDELRRFYERRYGG